MVKFSFFTRTIKTIKVMVCMLVFTATVNVSAASSKNNQKSDEVELVVSGEGATKDDATKVALRSAIEQAYGAFVSANTTILNDALVKDEIITVSSGTIKKYNYLAENNINGKYYVTLNAVVSVGKLVNYAQSKGGQTELAGATFAMDVQLKRLYKQNEEKVLQNLITQLKEIVPTMFDYSISVSSPEAFAYFNTKRGGYHCFAKITVKTNSNYTIARNLILNTLGGLCIKNKNILEDYRKKGIRPISVNFYNNRSNQYFNISNVAHLPLTYLYKNVFFLSGDFFKDLDSLFEKALMVTIDTGIKVKNVNIRPHIGKVNTRVDSYNGYRESQYNFPAGKSAKWIESTSLEFSKEELEKVSTIKVYQTK